MGSPSQDKDEDKKEYTQDDWREAIKQKGFDQLHHKFTVYFKGYCDWYRIEDSFSRICLRVGLLYLIFAGVLFIANGFSFEPPIIEIYQEQSRLDRIHQAGLGIGLIGLLLGLFLVVCHIASQLLGDGFSLDEFKKEGGIKRYLSKHEYFTIGLSWLIFPAFYVALNLREEPWQGMISLVLAVGIGVLVYIYFVSRLRGYTRAMSRNRTAWHKLELIKSAFDNNLITEERAITSLLEVVDTELDERHRDIVVDYHFFGDSVTGIIRKKS